MHRGDRALIILHIDLSKGTGCFPILMMRAAQASRHLWLRAFHPFAVGVDRYASLNSQRKTAQDMRLPFEIDAHQCAGPFATVYSIKERMDLTHAASKAIDRFTGMG